MKFDIEITKTLYAYNSDGSRVALKEGDEVYLKLDLEHMDLWDKKKYMQRYPDGWVRSIICYISNAGRSIRVEEVGFSFNFLQLTQKDILDVSDKAPKEKAECLKA